MNTTDLSASAGPAPSGPAATGAASRGDLPTGGAGTGHSDRAPLLDWAADLGWRLALVVAAAVLTGLSAPVPLRASVTALAVAVVVERVVRHRRRGMLDAALVGTGGFVVLLGLVGLLLNYLPSGITSLSWSIALVLLAIGMLTAAGLDGDEPPPSAFRPLLHRSAGSRARGLTALWAVVAAGVLSAAIVLSVRSYDSTHVAPVELSSSSVSNGVATITVAAGTAAGPFELDVVAGTGRTVVARSVDVAANTSVAVVVPVPAGPDVLVQLRAQGSTTVLRELRLDRPNTTSTPTPTPTPTPTGTTTR